MALNNSTTTVPASPAPPVGGVGYGVGLLGTLIRLNLAVSDVLAEITGAHGTNLADYLVLGVVRASPGSRTSPGALAETLGRTTGGISLTLDRLVDAGWVTKSRDPKDGRRSVVELTDAGMDLAVAVNRSLHDWEDELSLDEPDAVLERLESLTWDIRGRSEP